MQDEWLVPRQPVRRPARSPWIWSTFGALVGLLTNAIFGLVLWIAVPSPAGVAAADYQEELLVSVAVAAVPAVVVNLILLVIGIRSCLRRDPRSFGVGLLIGVSAGVAGTVAACYVAVTTAS